MNTQTSCLKDILERLNTPNNDIKVKQRTHIINDDARLLNLLADETIKNFSLTYAEQVLLYEGGQLGKADCTIPPYVEFENVINNSTELKPNYIRSELIEWALNVNVNKMLFKSGSLTIVGADFITNGDVVNREYRTIDSTKLFDNNGVFSLDLSSRDISIDLQFERCNFFSGINVSNSYCENMIFRTCRFGCATDYTDNKTYSILAKNALFKGEFIIEKHATPLSNEIEFTKNEGDKWVIINSNVDFSFAKVEGQLKIEGYEKPDENRRIRLNSTIVKGFLNFYSFVGNSINISYCTIKGDLLLSLAKFDYLFAFSCDINSVDAISVQCNSILFTNGSFIRYGMMCYKSIITGDFDCRGSFFGSSIEEGLEGVSVAINNSLIRSVYFSDGFIAKGKINMDYAKIENNINFQNSFLIGTQDEKSKKITAIYAPHLNVKNSITFNINPNIKPEKVKLFHSIELWMKFNDMELGEINAKTAEKILNNLSEFDPYIGNAFYYCYNLKRDHFNNIKGDFTRVYGEVNFEHAVIEGKMDCAGAIFNNLLNKQNGQRNLHNALNLRFAEIKGSLFINNGFDKHNLPFMAEGDVDLQNSSLNNLFISMPSKKNRNKKTRIKLIGAKYNYISADSTTELVADRKKLTLKIFFSPFYRAKWIYYTGRNFFWDFFRTRENNFRQPFEQFASALFKSGEDNRARDVLIYYRPSANILEWLIMNIIIRPIYFIGSRIYLCLLSLFVFLCLGACFFSSMRSYIRPLDTEFNSWLFSAQKLFPLIDIIDKDKYYLASETPLCFIFYYFFHSIIGVILLAMGLVNVARMRKGDS